MHAELISEVVTALNSHSAETLSQFLANDHSFLDTGKNPITEIEKTVAAWKKTFELFPDYTIQIENQIHHSPTIAVFGIVSGSYPTKINETKKGSWKIPFAWRIRIENEKIKKWEVYADTLATNKIISEVNREEKTTKIGVNGLGGVFFKSIDPKALAAWYDKYLGTTFGKNSYHTFKWIERGNAAKIGRTEFSLFSIKSDYFEPSHQPFMLNFRVEKLDAFLDNLKAEGVEVMDKRDYLEYGNFGWIIDLEGNKLEIWEAKDEILEAYDLEQADTNGPS